MLRKCLTALLLLFIVNLSQALTGYQIELIVFSHIKSKNLSSEDWPDIGKKVEDLKDAISLFRKVDSQYMMSVAPANFTLKREQRRIYKHSRYKTILHLAWRESLIKMATKTTIHLYGGELYDDQGNAISLVTNESTSYDPDQNWQLNGTFTISLQRYFDVNLNLVLAIPKQKIADLTNQKLAKSPQVFKYFKLLQSRRTRSKEINYIDHPLYGVLFKITPIDQEFSEPPDQFSEN